MFLTARDAVPDRLAGFAAGGDDYLTKPFNFAELVARLQALVRRGGTEHIGEVGGLRLDPVRHGIDCGGESAELTPTGDVLSGTSGRLHVFADEADPERLLPSLAALADLPIDQVIIPHGEPILTDGAARIRAAVAEAWGD
jgi:hypothetical protein